MHNDDTIVSTDRGTTLSNEQFSFVLIFLHGLLLCIHFICSLEVEQLIEVVRLLHQSMSSIQVHIGIDTERVFPQMTKKWE